MTDKNRAIDDFIHDARILVETHRNHGWDLPSIDKDLTRQLERFWDKAQDAINPTDSHYDLWRAIHKLEAKE